MKSCSLLAMLSVVMALVLPSLARAGEGHDHGDPAPATTGRALTRFAAVSDAFELVGVLDGRHITLWLDRAADNAPVTDASIELEVAGEKLQAQKHDDVYEVVLATEPEPGVLRITATVTAGNAVERLDGELDHHEDAHADPAARSMPWSRVARWVAGMAVALVLLLVIGRLAVSRQRHAGGAA